MTAQPTVLAIESASLTAWPGLMVAFDGSWVWRAARGHTRRANSINCLDQNDGADAEARIARFADLYRRHGLAPVFRITPLTAPGALDALDRLRWIAQDHSLVLGMPAPPAPLAAEAIVRDAQALDRDWLADLASLSGYDDQTIAATAAIIGAMPVAARGIVALSKDGEPASAVLAAAANGIGFFFNVVTAARHRGKGYGRAAMAAAINWCAAQNCRFLALQVLAENAPALRLYHGLGFTRLYGYHYRKGQ